MSTNFGLTVGSSQQAIVQSLNYALSNLAGGNILTVNNNGSVTFANGQTYSYLYQYLWVAYSTNSTGSSNFSFNPTNATYYGVHSSSSSTPSTNPADYVWTQVSGGFSTNKYLFYITYGGGKIDFYIGTTKPNSQYVQVQNGVAIDLSIITASISYATTSSVLPSIIAFPQNTDYSYTPTSEIMTATFTTGNTKAIANLYANISSAGNVTISPIYTDPSISVTSTYSNAASNNLTINFSQPNTASNISGLITVLVNGLPGNTANSGVSTYTLTAYSLDSFTPNTPKANTGSWNFATGLGTPPLDPNAGTTGNLIATWSLNPLQTNATEQVYSSTAIAIAGNTNPTANITNLTWSTPVISSALPLPTIDITYPNGQYILNNNGAYSPTPVSGIVTLTANVKALRSNTMLAAIDQVTEYFVANGVYQVGTNPATSYNGNLLTFSSPITSASTMYQTVSYSDVGGTATDFISEALLITTIGNTGPRGFTPMSYIVANVDPTTANSSVLTTMFEAPRTNTVPPIGDGFAPLAQDVAQFFYPNLSAYGGGVTAVYQYDGANWNTVQGQVISGNLIATGTITTSQVNANEVWTLQLASTNANFGNIQSPGFWMASQTGDAHFAGNLTIGANAVIGSNLNIGNDLIVGNNAVIGGNLTITGLVTGSNLNSNTVTTSTITQNSVTSDKLAANLTLVRDVTSTNTNVGVLSGPGYWFQANTGNAYIGGNLTIGNNTTIGSNLTVGANASIGNNLTVGQNASIGNNLTVGNNAVIGGNLTISGLVNGGNLAPNVVTINNIQTTSVSQITGTQVPTVVWYDSAHFGTEFGVTSNITLTNTAGNVSFLVTGEASLGIAANSTGTGSNTQYFANARIYGYYPDGTAITIYSNHPPGCVAYHDNILTSWNNAFGLISGLSAITPVVIGPFTQQGTYTFYLTIGTGGPFVGTGGSAGNVTNVYFGGASLTVQAIGAH